MSGGTLQHSVLCSSSPEHFGCAAGAPFLRGYSPHAVSCRGGALNDANPFIFMLCLSAICTYGTSPEVLTWSGCWFLSSVPIKGQNPLSALDCMWFNFHRHKIPVALGLC